jgi:hypothetical protein
VETQTAWLTEQAEAAIFPVMCILECRVQIPVWTMATLNEICHIFRQSLQVNAGTVGAPDNERFHSRFFSHHSPVRNRRQLPLNVIFSSKLYTFVGPAFCTSAQTYSSYSYMPEIPSAPGRLYRHIKNRVSSNNTETDNSK